jgi:acyl-CoA thioester hydrolase
VEASCTYRAPARFGDTLKVALRLAERSEKMIRYDFEIRRKADAELLCNGYIRIVALDLASWRATTLPHDLADRIAEGLK